MFRVNQVHQLSSFMCVRGVFAKLANVGKTWLLVTSTPSLRALFGRVRRSVSRLWDATSAQTTQYMRKFRNSYTNLDMRSTYLWLASQHLSSTTVGSCLWTGTDRIQCSPETFRHRIQVSSAVASVPSVPSVPSHGIKFIILTSVGSVNWKRNH